MVWHWALCDLNLNSLVVFTAGEQASFQSIVVGGAPALLG